MIRVDEWSLKHHRRLLISWENQKRQLMAVLITSKENSPESLRPWGECREWNPGETGSALETFINENCRENDAVLLLMAQWIDGRNPVVVTQCWWMLWLVRCVQVITTFRMQIEIRAITDVLQWLRQEKYSQLVTDSKTTERVPLCRLDGHYTQIEQIT